MMIYTFLDKDSGKVTFSSNDWVFFSVDHDKINLDDVNFDDEDPKTIIHVRLTAWRNKYKQRKKCKKDIGKELINVA